MQHKYAIKNSFAWFYLSLAILMEVAGTTAMKLSNGFTNFLPSVLIFVFYAFSLGFLTLSLKWLQIGFAYAAWSGLGTLLIFVISVLFFGEPLTGLKTLSLLFIIIGVMGLKEV